MDNGIKISVIIPVFNAETYLADCVNSVICQTYSNLEILLVDDASTDGSPQLCDEFAQKDERIRVQHKENGGTSDARNAGILMATGDYITFMDNDDYWNQKDAMEGIAEQLQQGQPDVLMHGNLTYWQEKGTWTQAGVMSRDQVFGQEKETALEHLLRGGVLSVMVWSKIIRRDLVLSNQLFFKKGIRNEDTDWMARLLLCSNTYDWYERSFYVYRKEHQGAQTSQKLTYGMICDLKNICVEYADYGRKNLTESQQRVFFSYLAYPYAVWMGQSHLVSGKYTAIKQDRKVMKQYAYLLDYDMQPEIQLVKKVKRILGYSLTAYIMTLYLKKTYHLQVTKE